MPEINRKKDRRIKLTYAQSVQLTEGDRAAEDFFSVGSQSTEEILSKLEFKNSRARERIEDILKTKFKTTDANIKGQEDSGWQLVDVYKEVDWSKVAYRIGIREIGLNNFTFANVSSKVSVLINSPKPIWKVVLRSVEQIPDGYDLSQAWIHYHVTFDEGKTWHRINPLDKPTRFDEEGLIVPRTITVNADSPSIDPETKDVKSINEIKSCRLRYTLYADSSSDSPTESSPVLNGVRLLVYSRNGLSDSQPEQVI